MFRYLFIITVLSSHCILGMGIEEKIKNTYNQCRNFINPALEQLTEQERTALSDYKVNRDEGMRVTGIHAAHIIAMADQADSS